jgi:DNA polymerase-3 subunit epsilon
LESNEIKKHQPVLNRAQRSKRYDFEIYTELTPAGYLKLSNRKTIAGNTTILKYATQKAMKNALLSVTKQFRLCRHFTLESATGAPCFEYHLGECGGACLGIEKIEDYNLRVNLALASLSNEILGDFYLIDKGPERNQSTLFKIEQGQFVGMGYVDMDIPGHHLQMEDAITKMPSNPEIQAILRQFMAKNHYKRIPFSTINGVLKE